MLSFNNWPRQKHGSPTESSHKAVLVILKLIEVARLCESPFLETAFT
jgi:hypothetical protein